MDPTVNRQADRYIPIAKPGLGPSEAEAAANAVRDNWVSSGPRVEEFEHEFAAAHGKAYGVACNSGTTALHLAMVAMGVDGSSNVYIPDMTMIACGNAAQYCGNYPYFVDSESTTGNIDLSKLKFHKPDVLLLPHLYGMPIRGTKTIDPEKTIEDCAESHYATLSDGSPVGSHGRFAVFSFYANKIITCGEGGMVLTNDSSEADLLRQLRSHAFTPGEHFNHQRLAFGYRMTDVQAAIGLAQHARRHEFLDKRRVLYFRYCSNLSGVPWINWARRPNGSVDWLFPAQVIAHAWEGDLVHSIRDHLRWQLAESGIETRTWFKPLHTQQHLESSENHDSTFPVANALYENGICLPIYFEMELSDVDYICERLIAAGQRTRAEGSAVPSGTSD